MSTNPQVPSQEEGPRGNSIALYFFAGTMILGFLLIIAYVVFGM